MLRIAFVLGLAAATILAMPADAQTTVSRVQFTRGKSSATMTGIIRGDQSRDYLISARSGQRLRIELTGAPIVYFNLLAPGSLDEAIFIGSTSGGQFGGRLEKTGVYRVRVYQMRASARRGETGAYRLRMAVTR